MRNDKYDQKIDRRKKKLRSPLNLTGTILVLAERFKKKDAPVRLYKISIENVLFSIEIEFLLFINGQS